MMQEIMAYRVMDTCAMTAQACSLWGLTNLVGDVLVNALLHLGSRVEGAICQLALCLNVLQKARGTRFDVKRMAARGRPESSLHDSRDCVNS